MATNHTPWLATFVLALVLVGPVLGQTGVDLSGLVGLLETLVSLLQGLLDAVSGLSGA